MSSDSQPGTISQKQKPLSSQGPHPNIDVVCLILRPNGSASIVEGYEINRRADFLHVWPQQPVHLSRSEVEELSSCLISVLGRRFNLQWVRPLSPGYMCEEILRHLETQQNSQSTE